MPYFPVDDQLAFHPKVMAAGNEAMGIWVRAGAICKQHATGGFVSSATALSLGRQSAVNKIVAAGLWDVVEGGYQFHDWEHQAGNFGAAEEKARREETRRKDRERKQNQRSRERAGHATSHSEGHGVTPTGIQGTPSPVPSPLGTDTQSSPVPDRESSPQGPDEESLEVVCTRQLAGLGVEYPKVKSAIAKAAGRIPDPTMVVRISATILDRATPPVKSPTGVVIAAVRNDWPEWQKLIDEQQAVAS